MKTQLIERSEYKLLSEFDPTPILCLPSGVGKLVWGLIRRRPSAYTLHSLSLCKVSAH